MVQILLHKKIMCRKFRQVKVFLCAFERGGCSLTKDEGLSGGRTVFDRKIVICESLLQEDVEGGDRNRREHSLCVGNMKIRSYCSEMIYKNMRSRVIS